MPQFGILIPGSEVKYDFEQYGDKGVVTIQNPGAVNVIGFFMNTPLADSTVGATLSYSMPPEYSGLIFIGAIANVRPSDIFHTGWALNPNVNQLSELKLICEIQ
mmetsp:Transcript_10505/g.14151  ORF Transcript_10505/g.14151 Transcript_10505/m.14151 type:complete len:104 (+) Transcript_10505:26-337(+)